MFTKRRSGETSARRHTASAVSKKTSNTADKPASTFRTGSGGSTAVASKNLAYASAKSQIRSTYRTPPSGRSPGDPGYSMSKHQPRGRGSDPIETGKRASHDREGRRLSYHRVSLPQGPSLFWAVLKSVKLCSLLASIAIGIYLIIRANAHDLVLRNHIAKLKKALYEKRKALDQGPNVIFSALQSRNDAITPDDKNIKFDKILTNVGGGYNNKTGIFTCPVSGVYVFHTSFFAKVNVVRGWLLKLYVNEEQTKVYMYQHKDGIGGLYASQTASLRLNKTDKISIRLSHSVQASSTILHGLSPKKRTEPYRSFTGYLLRPR